MAFIKKLWKDRISEFPNRRTVNDGYVTKQVTVGRDEGNITEEGDSFDASNMNDLEQRIEDAYGDVQALVGDEVAAQYNQENVIFDPVATEGHGTGFVVSSDYIANLEAGDLKNVNISSPAEGEALVFDENGNLVNGTVSTVGGLNDLNDVTIDDTSLEDKQELVFNEDEGVFENKTTRVELTQAEYDQLVADDEVLPDVDYYITDAPSMQGTSADLSYDGTTKSTYTKIEEVASDVAGIIESGSNSNGNYIKYADGSMICTKTVSIGLQPSDWNAWGSCYDSSIQDLGSWSNTFINTPVVNATVSGAGAWIENVWDFSTTTSGKLRFVRPSIPGGGITINLQVIGIGRWKA